MDDTEFNIFPNPTKSKLNIVASNIQSVEIFEINGRLIDKFLFDGVNKTKILLDNYIKGQYLIRVQTVDMTIVKPLIKF
jgi:hypothetical protein